MTPETDAERDRVAFDFLSDGAMMDAAVRGTFITSCSLCLQLAVVEVARMTAGYLS